MGECAGACRRPAPARLGGLSSGHSDPRRSSRRGLGRARLFLRRLRGRRVLRPGRMSERETLIAEIEGETAETARLTGRATLTPRVRAALRRVPREAFVLETDIAEAYDSAPLPIGHGQT